MTETPESTLDAPAQPKKRSGGLNSMLLADLKSMASGLGVSGAGSMKKAQLIDAIKAAQGGPQSRRPDSAKDESAPAAEKPAAENKPAQADRNQAQQPQKDAPSTNAEQGPEKTDESAGQQRQRQRSRNQNQGGQNQGNQNQGNQNQGGQNNQNKQGSQNQPNQQNQNEKNEAKQAEPTAQDGAEVDGDNGDDGEGRTRNRRRRGRDRDRSRGGNRNEPDTLILEDDVLVPAAGILDVLDNYAFVRTSGYLPGVDDVYLSLTMVRKFGLRRGDAIVGQVRQPREGERREKFNPMVRIDSVNGAEPESAKNRVEFEKLTPLHPTERLRMESGADDAIGRVIDLVAPIGKGQRGLIVASGETGKTTMLHAIAKAITSNNPECHLMVVLVDERPEEVTDFQRSVKGEVVASTFDRPPLDHTIVAELAIERAKRLVELGHDVVVLLDGLTRLGRAYNLSAPSGGRVLTGGVDTQAIYPPKRFFGAARSIENGGSLTILATAHADSGSSVDEVFLEELGSTGNFELRLRRDLAERGLFPAVDVRRSGTRREDQLVGAGELAIARTLRRQLTESDEIGALTDLLERVQATSTNIELLTRLESATR